MSTPTVERCEESDAGVAAIELVFVFLLVFAFALIAYPLGDTFVVKQRLQRAADEAVRFASSTPNTPEYGSTSRRPADSAVETQAQEAAMRDGVDSSGNLSDVQVVVTDFSCDSGFDPSSCTPTTAPLQSGDMVKVQLTYCHSLGPFGFILGANGTSVDSGTCPDGSQTLTATATAREE